MPETTYSSIVGNFTRQIQWLLLRKVPTTLGFLDTQMWTLFFSYGDNTNRRSGRAWW